MSVLGLFSSINKALTSSSSKVVDSSDDERDNGGSNRTTSVAAGDIDDDLTYMIHIYLLLTIYSLSTDL